LRPTNFPRRLLPYLGVPEVGGEIVAPLAKLERDNLMHGTEQINQTVHMLKKRIYRRFLTYLASAWS
jgi:hypothetical protein